MIYLKGNMNKDKIEDKIKELNAIRAIYHKDYEEFEKQYKEKEISKEDLEKHKINYEKKRKKMTSSQNESI